MARTSSVRGLCAEVRGCCSGVCCEWLCNRTWADPNWCQWTMQDACASSMTTGLNIYKRTDNLSESQPRMTSDWPRTWDQWQRLPFEVPLHDNDKQYGTFTTGLIKVQGDIVNERHTDWLIRLSSPDFPEYLYADPASHTSGSVNGCSLSLSANRSYYIGEIGDYVLQTQGATLIQSCDNFAVKMACSGGGETALPADSDPLGFSADAKTGKITGTPQRVRDGYRMRLRAVDAAEVRSSSMAQCIVQWGDDST